MTDETSFILTFAEAEEIYREGWRDGSRFDGDFSDNLGALETENESWDESRARRELFHKEDRGEHTQGEGQRIRRELLEAAKGASERIGGWECGEFSCCSLAEHARDVLTIDDLREALDKICPEEG